jgi:hypothetical protein
MIGEKKSSNTRHAISIRLLRNGASSRDPAWRGVLEMLTDRPIEDASQNAARLG